MKLTTPEHVIEKVKAYRDFMSIANDESGAYSLDERVAARHAARDLEMQIAIGLELALEYQETTEREEAEYQASKLKTA